jgi:hypothetical protein
VGDAPSLLFDLPGFRVVSCDEISIGLRPMVVMQAADEHAARGVGVEAGGRLYDLRSSPVEDL